MDFYTWRERRRQGLPGFESPVRTSTNTQTSQATRDDDEEDERYTSTSQNRGSQSRIDPQEWAKSSAAIINEIGEYYGGYKQTDAAVDSDIADRALDLLSKASSVRNQFARDSESRKSIDEIVSSLSQAYTWATERQSEYSQYDTAAQYKYRDNTDFYDKYGKYLEAEDFEEYAARGAAVKNPTFDEVDGGLSIGSWKPFAEEVGNIVTYSRDNYGKIALEGPNATGKVEYSRMTDDEVNIYNYLLAKDGKETADKFLSEIEESLNSRMGAFLAENIEDSQPFLKNLAYITSSIGSGIEQSRSGYRQFVSNEKIATPTSTYTSQYLSDNLGTVGKTLYQTGSNIGNMLPNIAIAMITGQPIAGDISMGISAAGNAYGQALLDGRNEGEARLYSTIIGAFEAGLQHALGGISKLSGAANLTGKIAAKAAQIDNAAVRIIAKYGSSIGGEIVEEELQNFLEPAFQSILFGEDYDAPTIDEILETAVVTALSTGILESGSIIGGDIATSRFNKEQYGDSANEIITEALEIDPDNIYAQNLKKRVDSGNTVSGNQLAKLIQQNEETIVKNDRTAIENAAKNRLTELGENSADIDTVAKAITKDVFGEKLNTQEKYAVEASIYGNRVRGELNPENIRSGNYTTSWAENLNTNRINVDEYSAAVNRANADATASSDVNSGFAFPESVTIPDNIYNGTENAAVTAEAQNAASDSASRTDTGNRIDSASPYIEQSPNDELSSTDTADTIGRDSVNAEAAEITEVTADSAPDTKVNPKANPKQVPNKSKASTNQSANETEPVVSDTENAGITDETAAQADESVSLSSLSKKYGRQAQAMVHTYIDGQDVVKYDRAYQAAYDMGRSGVSRGYAMQSDSAAYLNESQRQLAYEAGQAAAGSIAGERQSSIERRANGKNGWKRGVVRGEGVTLDELKSQFNDTQNQAYKILSTISEATGIDIALYKSESDESGSFTGAQGYYKRSDAGTIYLDINAGLTNVKDVGDLSKYTILRTFSHEFTHYIENWSPVRYNELRAAVFSHLTESGEDVGELIERQQALMSEDGRDVSYDRASREVVAEAMVDILPDSKFIDSLAENHKSVFDKLLEKLKDFISNLKSYFGRLYQSSSPEARAMKRQLGETLSYAESIVEKFDAAAVNAVENYQLTVATDELTENIDDDISSQMIDTEVKIPNISKPDNISFKKIDYYILVKRSTDKKEKLEKVSGYTDGNFNYTRSSKGQWTSTLPNTGVAIADGYSRENIIEETYNTWDKIKNADNFTEIYKRTYNIYQKALADMSTESTETTAQGDTAREDSATDEVAETTAETAAETTAETEVNESAPTAEAAEGETFRDKYMRAPREQRDEVIDALGHKDKRKSSQFPTSIPADETSPAAEINENTEVTANGTESTEAVKTENGGTADTGAVSEPAGMGEGAPRLPAGLQEENLQGMDELGGAVPVSDERGAETRRDGSRTDSGRSGGRPDEGDSQSGDLRGSDRVEATTPPETVGQSQETAGQSQVESQANADETQSNTDSTGAELTDKIAEIIEQRSQEKPKGTNFVIGDSLDLPNGEKSRFRANVDAIRTLYNIMSENRFASPEEQVILSKYVGWGGLDKAFSGYHWKAEYDELRSLVKEGIISEDDYNAARRSTMNAHYTDISVIKAMYDGLSRLGFNGGRMLEPSAGVGNFIGAMPDEMTAKVKSWTAVELDNITGNILKYLYPNSDVRIEGFEKANIPDGYMDVAIGNVPFGNYAVIDKSYPKQVTGAIHNYFFAKSLDKVRPGGIVMFITSNYTMNSKDPSVRRYIMNKADLLGAIALPEGAFKENAGTEVATTIMILKRRADGTPYAGADFLESEGITLENDKYSYMGNVYQNRYFAEHPEMVLGTPARNEMYQSRDSITYKPLPDRGSLASQIREAFSHIDGKMDYPAKPSKERTNYQVEKNVKKPRDGSLVSKDGKIYEERGGELVERELGKAAIERAKGLIDIRDAMRNLLLYQQQGLKKSEIDKARKLLNKLYDEFVSKYGYLNTTANRSALYDDPDKYAVLALENYNRKQKSATKSDIFTKNTVSPNRTVTSAKSIGEAVAVSMNESGGVDTELIARLTARDEESVKRELIDSRIAFKKKDGSLEIAETYLSGNVRAKLREAEALAAFDEDYNNNIEALREVMPKDIAHTDIYVNPGATWIPTSVYSDFARELLGISTWQRDTVSITYNDIEGYKVILNNKRAKEGARNRQVWGTPKRTFVNILEALLNSRSLSVGYKGEDGKYHVDKDATTAANAKAEEVANEFRKWLWNDETRKNELSRLYNDVFNAIVTPKYNGDNLTVNGTNPEKPLRPHQRDAVERIIMSGGNTLLAHKVGAGKTYEMAAAAMKLRELGIAKKPMFIVPKALVAQWGKEFNSFFPASKLLVAEDNDFSPSNRKIFTNRIRNGDWDAVIVSYEQFEKVPMSAEFQKQFYTEQVNEIIATIEAEKAESGKFASVKDLEKRRVNLENKIKKLSDVSRDEDNIIFEDLGVDSLFVDEAHNFKNLFYTTHMTNIAGLGNKNGSARAFDLYTKVRYLQGLNGGRGIVFATATPVMNSMSEMYIMQQYLQPDILKSLGINNFDAWAKQFGEVVNGVEIKPSGQGYRIKQSFSRFKNLSELQMLFRNFADVLTNIPGLKVPKMKGGGVITVVSEPSQFQQDYMKALEERADNVKNVDPHEDNMLKITSDGRKVSYTQRMIDPSLPYEEGCKIYKCADNVAQIYKETAGIKGTQIIFCDMATPKSGSGKTDAEVTDELIDTDSAQLYDDIRARLVSEGVKAEEIAFIHDANTDLKRRELFDAMNDGTVRVLIGSTGKMGVGMNAQKRIVAIHHLDAPWRPGDVEQRDGRAFRQGNMNDEVSKFVYVTKGSFDTRLWDILERKQNFINQIMNGDNVGREVEDTGEVTLSAAEVKALASGSPLILEQVQLETDIKKLESLQRSHNQAAAGALTKYAQDAARIAEYRERVKEASADMSTMHDTWSDGKFEVNIGGRIYKGKKDAGLALIAEAQAKAVNEGYTKIGEFAGLSIQVVKTSEGIDGVLSGTGSYPFKTYPGNPTHGINVLASTASGLQEKLDGWKSGIETATADMKLQKELAEKPFEGQAELDKKRARYKEVMDILNPREEQSLDTLDEDTDTQEQRREGTLSDREVLERAALQIDSSKYTAEERAALELFQKRAGILGELEAERAKLGTQYNEQQFGANVDRAAAAETLQQMHALDEQIKTASEDILNVEQRSVLKNILVEARGIVEAQEREHGRELIRRYRDRRNEAADIKKYRSRLMTDIGDLMNYMTKPDFKSSTSHIPDALKNPIIDFLNSIDFSSKRKLGGGEATKADIAFASRLSKLRRALNNTKDLYGMYSGTIDLPDDFMERYDEMVDSVMKLTSQPGEERAVMRMSSAELKNLSELVRSLKTAVKRFNTFHQNNFFKHVTDAADDTIGYLDSLPRDEKSGVISDYAFWKMMRPAYAFERFGEGGKSIYDELRRGQARLAFHVKEIESFTKETFSDKEVKDWEKQQHAIKLSDGQTIKMTTAQIMGLYELYKQEDSRRHILSGGIRVPKFSVRQGLKKNTSADNGHIVTEADVASVLSRLTDRQREVADKLQKYMATTGAEWGNYVSMARFGERLFTNEQYYPINVDRRQLDSRFEADKMPAGASLYALLNMSFTKQRQEEAKNGIMTYSIFDVFANHMSDMAQYNAMALPVLDALKWLNYRRTKVDEKGKAHFTGDTVRKSLENAYGRSEKKNSPSESKGYAVEFIENILKAYNNTESMSNPYDNIGLKALNKYNRSLIAYNLRVYVQQPSAIARAAKYLGAKDILSRASLAHYFKNRDEMLKYSGIAVWKGLGFYDINISRGLNSLIKHDENVLGRFNDTGMKPAELLDSLTWAAIWGASKNYVTRTKGLSDGDPRFIAEVIRTFEDTIYKTQVVDSVLTRSELMRNKSFFIRSATSFMSEPAIDLSMMADEYFNLQLDAKRIGAKAAAQRHIGSIARSAAVLSVGAILNTALASVVDALRDDDDYQEWYEKYAEAFLDNLKNALNPLERIPFLSDFSELIKSTAREFGADTYGNQPSLAYMQWSDSYLDAVTTLADKLQGEETNYQWYQVVYKLLQAASGLTGISAAPLVRDAVSIWNSAISMFDHPELKVRTWYPGDKNNIKYAYLDGNLTADEAMDELIRVGEAEDEDEAYFTVKEWDSGDASWSRFSELYGAVLEGKGYNEAARELEEHGYSEREIRESVQSQIGKWYREKDISKAKAEALLKKHTELDEDEIDKFITEWSAKRETGISYDDIKESYLDGEISRERAVEMRAKYGGKSEEEAEDDVMAWDFERENPEVGSVSAATVKKYKELCEPIGISVEEWNAVREFYSEAESDVDRKGKTIPNSKRDKVAEYIDSLPLKRRQKDALWLAMDYSENTLDEAPWR